VRAGRIDQEPEPGRAGFVVVTEVDVVDDDDGPAAVRGHLHRMTGTVLLDGGDGLGNRRGDFVHELSSVATAMNSCPSRMATGSVSPTTSKRWPCFTESWKPTSIATPCAMAELDAESAQAQDREDLARNERAAVERDALIRELTAAAELGGRSRRLGDGTERARKTVTTGTHCAYTPTESPGS
jgi:hypothetical protein